MVGACNGDEYGSQAGQVRITRLVLLGLVFLNLLGCQPSALDEKSISKELAPDFTITRYTSNETLTLSELRGKVVVVLFWASWCQPCRIEATELERIWNAYKEQGVVLVGVGYKDIEKKARECIEELDLTFFIGPDPEGEIARAYGVLGVPETYIIGVNGELEFAYKGQMDGALLEEKIQEALTLNE